MGRRKIGVSEIQSLSRDENNGQTTQVLVFVLPTVARRGHPWENGYAERLIRTLKDEEVHLNDSEDIHEAKEHIEKTFITQVYHQKRLTRRWGFDSYGISTTKLVLTLRNCGLNKRMHFNL